MIFKQKREGDAEPILSVSNISNFLGCTWSEQTIKHAINEQGCDHSSPCDTCQVWRKSLHGSLLCTIPPSVVQISEQILPVMTSALCIYMSQTEDCGAMHLNEYG